MISIVSLMGLHTRRREQGPKIASDSVDVDVQISECKVVILATPQATICALMPYLTFKDGWPLKSMAQTEYACDARQSRHKPQGFRQRVHKTKQQEAYGLRVFAQQFYLHKLTHNLHVYISICVFIQSVTSETHAEIHEYTCLLAYLDTIKHVYI